MHFFRHSALLLLLVATAAQVFYQSHGNAAAGEPVGNSTAEPGYVGKLKFLALGDSYTIGESVAAGDRWPNQLAEELRKTGVDLGDPQIIARTGWTTGDLLGAMDSAKPAGPYDLVMLLIGVNNQFQGRSEEEYRKQFTLLLNRSIVLAGNRSKHVIVLSIPDWSATPLGRGSSQTSKAIDRFNAINREQTQKTKAVYVDVTPASRQAATQPELVAEDGLHPSARQYRLWVDAALSAAQAAVK